MEDEDNHANGIMKPLYHTEEKISGKLYVLYISIKIFISLTTLQLQKSYILHYIHYHITLDPSKKSSYYLIHYLTSYQETSPRPHAHIRLLTPNGEGERVVPVGVGGPQAVDDLPDRRVGGEPKRRHLIRLVELRHDSVGRRPEGKQERYRRRQLGHPPPPRPRSAGRQGRVAPRPSCHQVGVPSGVGGTSHPRGSVRVQGGDQ